MPEPKITKDSIIGEVMEKYPGTAEVFKRHFGKGCFTCPGANNEDIYFGSTMHNADMETVLQELNAIAGKG